MSECLRERSLINRVIIVRHPMGPAEFPHFSHYANHTYKAWPALGQDLRGKLSTLSFRCMVDLSTPGPPVSLFTSKVVRYEQH